MQDRARDLEVDTLTKGKRYENLRQLTKRHARARKWNMSNEELIWYKNTFARFKDASKQMIYH